MDRQKHHRQTVERIGISEGEHREPVGHRLKTATKVTTNALRGRIGVEELGMRSLKILELAQERIILKVAHLGEGLDIVFVVEQVDPVSQLFYFLLHSWCVI